MRPAKRVVAAALMAVSLTVVAYRIHSSSVSAEVAPRTAGAALPDPKLLRQGDIVLRTGKGIISGLLQKMSLRDRSFSHAGILLDSCGQWFVLHMLGGEGSAPQDLRLEPLGSFCGPENSDSAAVFRLTDSERIRRDIVTECWKLMLQSPRFDERFDLATDDELYCTEMVYKVLLKASRGEISLPLTEFAGERYAACDDLYLNDYAQLIRSH